MLQYMLGAVCCSTYYGTVLQYMLGSCLLQYILWDCVAVHARGLSVKVHARGLSVAVDCGGTFWEIVEVHARGLPVAVDCCRTFWEIVEVHARGLLQYMLGYSLLVAPVLTAGQTSRRVYLPKGCTWTDVSSSLRVCSTGPLNCSVLLVLIMIMDYL